MGRFVELSDLLYNCCQQWLKAFVNCTPDEFLGDIVIIMSIHIADTHDGAPGQCRMLITNCLRKPACRFRDDFESASDCIKCSLVGAESLKRQAGSELLRKHDIVANVE